MFAGSGTVEPTHLINKLVGLWGGEDDLEQVEGGHCPAERAEVAKPQREDNICGVGVEQQPDHGAAACLGRAHAPAVRPQITDHLDEHHRPQDEGDGRPEAARGDALWRPAQTEHAEEEDGGEAGADNGQVADGGGGGEVGRRLAADAGENVQEEDDGVHQNHYEDQSLKVGPLLIAVVLVIEVLRLVVGKGEVHELGQKPLKAAVVDGQVSVASGEHHRVPLCAAAAAGATGEPGRAASGRGGGRRAVGAVVHQRRGMITGFVVVIDLVGGGAVGSVVTVGWLQTLALLGVVRDWGRRRHRHLQVGAGRLARRTAVTTTTTTTTAGRQDCDRWVAIGGHGSER